MTDNNKPTVVDDFFSALFANDNNKLLNSKEEPQEQEQKPYQRQDAQVKGELDEFDEYSLLSSKRKLDDDGDHQAATGAVVKKRLTTNEPNHILSKKSINWSGVSPESRMLIRQLPNQVGKEEVMEYFSTYGEVLEVVFKQAFGFVQFDNPSACANAVKCENGKKFKGVFLDLEVCHTKPYFARDDDKQRQRRFGATVSKPNGKHQRRNEDYQRKTETRQRPPKIEEAEYDPQRPEMNVPMVKIIAWNNVSKPFISHVENEFKKKNISVGTVTLQYPNTRDSLLKNMVREGVKAVVTINRDLENRKEICLQVFSANASGQGARFDEYDSILCGQAAEIVLQSLPRSAFEFTKETPVSSANSYYATAISAQVPTMQPLTTSLDSNTLAALYNVLQTKPSPVRQYQQSPPMQYPTQAPNQQYMHQQPQQQQQQQQQHYQQYQQYQQPPQSQQSQPIQQQQPSVSQLLATLMTGLAATSQPQSHTLHNNNYNNSYSSPQPIHPNASVSPNAPAAVQPNIAQLLSTAMNGYPVLGQLVSSQSSDELPTLT
ncbi:hypothetical protein BY458DRAFT_524872 [Sporodiniella umbellata]|nr:hypothetical protein BY458DRAFT_524872 [Sporodiniella umbellata]